MEDIVSEKELAFLKDIIKHIKKRCKLQSTEVDKAKQNYHDFGMYDDCGESYKESKIFEEGVLEGMVRCKIMLEKYHKKLRYSNTQNTGEDNNDICNCNN